ncbi:ribonuclease P protein component [Arthrobacter echini]|uniref:Ribonuclease P protein component n=1 Tax=Arthrobacter echini TaxID=1529066 RepID=A0A5D0XUI8_9MICC|nr:ribonuclease P protein component [Arthrobacter echini]TYD00535.1 ribonuclease P protein component [Arthrobacter echini]
MLPVINRVRAAGDFSHTVRSGARAGRRNVLLYGVLTSGGSPSRVGFIVGKNVGNAVARNLVKRRLRYAALEQLRAHPYGYDLVVRALPAAGTSDWQSLRHEFAGCLGTVVRKLERTDRADREGGVS